MPTLRPAAALAMMLVGLLPRPAAAIPAFARRYRVSCAMCHVAIPKLNAFGDRFAANGYRMSPTEEPRDTIGVGDKDLSLLRELPLAVRLDAYAQAYADGKVVKGGTDLTDDQVRAIAAYVWSLSRPRRGPAGPAEGA